MLETLPRLIEGSKISWNSWSEININSMGLDFRNVNWDLRNLFNGVSVKWLPSDGYNVVTGAVNVSNKIYVIVFSWHKKSRQIEINYPRSVSQTNQYNLN